MGVLARLASVGAALAMVTIVWPSVAFAAPSESGLSLEIRSRPASQSDQAQLTLAVTNTSTMECGLSTVADGTVRIISVRHNGRDLVPTLGRSFHLDGIGSAIKAGLVPSVPDSTVDVVLPSLRVHDGADAGSVVLRSVVPTSFGGGLDALWPIGVPGRYEVTASYAVPRMDGACEGMAAARTTRFTVGGQQRDIPWLWVLVGGLLVLATVVGFVALARGHRAVAGAVLAVLAVLAASVTTSRPARADYSIDPTHDFPAVVDACLKGFAAPGSDPAGVLNRLTDKRQPIARIVPTTGGSQTFEAPSGSTVVWHPTAIEPYGDGVARDPCAALYHELVQADAISRNAVARGECGDTGIKTAEVEATFAENRYRKAKRLPPRTEYHGTALPRSLDECWRPATPKPPQVGPVRLCEGSNRCGGSNGDPHLVTFDRTYYDLQSVGEFVVVRSTAGAALEVQTRQAPLHSSRTVSVNTAVGFRLGRHKVSLTLVEGLTEVRVDGEVVTVRGGERRLSGGGRLVRRASDIGPADGYDLHWPDGSEAAVDPIGGYGYRLLVRLAAGRAGKVEGLLGNFDGDPSNDIGPPAGPRLTQLITFGNLDQTYVDSWRIPAADSVLAYAEDQGTETFTDRTFPERPLAVTDLDADTRAQAEEICRWAGVRNPWQFAECVLDVGVSGRPEFATGAAGSERVAPPVAAPVTANPLVSATLKADGIDRLTFDGRAGQAVFVDFVAPALPTACSPYRLLDPTGQTIGRGCNVDGVGRIDRTELPADGRYTVVLDAGPGSTGAATARVYVSRDVAGAITPNGSTVSTAIEQPGGIVRYRFAGRSGQRVFLDVTETSLPNQCSPLELRDPTNRLLTTGCVVNGSGAIEGTVLPVDGTYTVTVDPNDRTVGTVHMRLFAAADQTASITPDGRPVVAAIGQPGLVMRYQFTGTAGAAVAVEATEATLPDQCSPLELRDPSGHLLASGCVITGAGDIRPTVLPVAGTYSVVVDPSGAATGKVTLTLRG